MMEEKFNIKTVKVHRTTEAMISRKSRPMAAKMGMGEGVGIPSIV